MQFYKFVFYYTFAGWRDSNSSSLGRTEKRRAGQGARVHAHHLPQDASEPDGLPGGVKLFCTIQVSSRDMDMSLPVWVFMQVPLLLGRKPCRSSRACSTAASQDFAEAPCIGSNARMRSRSVESKETYLAISIRIVFRSCNFETNDCPYFGW